MQIRSVPRPSVLGGDRAPPAERIVHTALDGVIVVAETRADNRRGTAGEGGVAEVVVLIFGLGRPVRGEHVFETRADGPAVLLVAGCRKADRGACRRDGDIRVVAPGITALGIDQPRPPRVADAARHGAELVVPGR